MGVIRREGDWRLEKLEEGLYEITHQKDKQAEIRTQDYRSSWGNDVAVGLVPVHEVDSYAEAEGLFEEYAHGGTPSGSGSIEASATQRGRTSRDQALGEGSLNFEDDLSHLDNLENLPPGGLSLVFLIGGGVIISASPLRINEPVFIIGAGLLLSGLGIIGWSILIGTANGWDEAIEFLTTTRENSNDSSSGSGSSEDIETIPPTPESIKNKLIFGRANQRCEWCSDQTDHPEVHHIEPRSEGGTNDESNLIVLCPSCHRKADSGGISKTKLRGKLRHIYAE